MSEIKPIETVYNGYRFRSRLEARWAVFFDALGIKYEYEPEGFRFPDGSCYLPDFYLPELNTFFEVKGIMNDADMHKINQLLKYSGKPVVIGYADMSFQASDLWHDEHPQPDGTFYYTFASKEYSLLIYCYECKKYSFMGQSGCWICQSCGADDGDYFYSIEAYGDWHSRSSPDVRNAFLAARQARFEHGEAPRYSVRAQFE